MTIVADRQFVFMEFPATLGSLRISVDRKNFDFRAYPDVRVALDRLESRARFGVVSSVQGLTPATVAPLIEGSVFLGLFDFNLHVPPLASSTHYKTLAAQARGTADSGVLVSRIVGQRAAALAAGFRTVSTIGLLESALDHEEITYVRIRSTTDAPCPIEALAAIKGLEILHITSDGGRTLYGLASATAFVQLDKPGLQARRLCSPAETARCDLYLIRNGYDQDLLDQASRLPIADEGVDGLVIALPAGESIFTFHPRKGGHGHTDGLFRASPRRHTTMAAPIKRIPSRLLGKAEKDFLKKAITDKEIREEFDPLIGHAPLAGTQMRIKSRHINHIQNTFATHHIAARLGAIMEKEVKPEKIPTSIDLFNVEADLTGESHPNELVVIGAHFDSFAKDSTTGADDAPGGDDDATGVAGVLAIARAFKELVRLRGRPPARTIRFALFNSEESDKSGSEHASKKILGEQTHEVVAMIQMDMIGYTRGKPGKKIFEIHAAGKDDYSSEPLATESQHLARIIEAARNGVSDDGLEPPQMYPPEGCPRDLAFASSDHHLFLLDDWPACLVAENFWVEGCILTAEEPKLYKHDGYHSVKDTDTYVCKPYVADVARVVAAAAWMIATA